MIVEEIVAMSTSFIRLQACRRALVVVLGLGFMIGTLLGPVSLLEPEHSVGHHCHHHGCGLLMPVSTLPPATVLAWFVPMVPVILFPGHAVVVFKPPRLHTH
jgi:hypothetical protein